MRVGIKNEKKLISVIIPVYNVKYYIRECLDSVLAQTYSELEILLVDDGSTDGSDRICDEYAQNDARIRVIHRKNGGLSVARNTGIHESRGEYLSFVDSDDAVSPVFIECLYNMCVESGSDIAICGIKVAGGKDGVKMDSLLSGSAAYDCQVDRESSVKGCDIKEYTSRELLDLFYNPDMHHNIVVAWNKLYRREIIADIRYPEGVVYEDESTTHAFIYNSQKIAYTEAKLYFYRKRPGSITTSKFSLKRLDVLEAYKRRRQFYAEHDEKIYEVREEYCQLSAFLDFYYILGKKMPTEKRARKELLDDFRDLYKNYDKSAWELKRRMFYAVCYIFPSLYGVIHSVRIK